jgi:hypothetical protein
MIVESRSTNLSYYKERYNPNTNLPERSGLRMIINNEIVYWYKFFHDHRVNFQEFDNLQDVKILMDYLNTFPNLFQHINILNSRINLQHSQDEHIHLNKFVYEINNCSLPFTVIGRRKLII